MNTLKSLILFTSVLFLYDTLWAQTSIDPALVLATLGSGGEAKVGDEKSNALDAYFKSTADREDAKSCKDAMDKMTDALTTAKNACKDAGQPTEGDVKKDLKGAFRKCEEKAQFCADLISEGEPDTELDSSANLLGITTQMLGISGLNLSGNSEPPDPERVKGQCYGRKDYEQQVKDIKKELEDVEDDISKIQKDISQAQEDAADEKKKLNEELADLSEKSRKEDLDNAETARSQAADAMKAQAEARAQKASTNLEIIQAQGSLSEAIGNRARAMLQFTPSLMKRKCLDEADAALAKETAIKAQSASSLIQSNRQKSKARSEDFNKCMADIQLWRDMTAEKANSQIQQLEETIKQKQTTVRDIDQSLSLSNSQQAQRDAETAASKQQTQVERQYRQMTLKNTQQTLESTTSQKINSLNQRLSDANKKKNDASAQLALLGTTPAGEKAPQEAIGALEEYNGAFAKCVSTCGQDACEKQDITKRNALGLSNPATAGGPSTVIPSAGATTAPVKAVTPSAADAKAKGTDGKKTP